MIAPGVQAESGNTPRTLQPVVFICTPQFGSAPVELPAVELPEPVLPDPVLPEFVPPDPELSPVVIATLEHPQTAREIIITNSTDFKYFILILLILKLCSLYSITLTAIPTR
jgi:hypothetical protein